MIKRIALAALAAFAFSTAVAQEKPATAPAAPATKPVPGTEPDVRIFQEMFLCMEGGLPPDWNRAWITVVELDRTDDGKSRNYEAIFRYATKPDDRDGEDLKNCGAQRILAGVADLNDYLRPDQRNWTEVTITFFSEGKYEVKYGYNPLRVPAKPGAKPAAAKPEAAKPGAKPEAPKPAAKPPADPPKAGFKIGQ